MNACREELLKLRPSHNYIVIQRRMSQNVYTNAEHILFGRALFFNHFTRTRQRTEDGLRDELL